MDIEHLLKRTGKKRTGKERLGRTVSAGPPRRAPEHVAPPTIAARRRTLKPAFRLTVQAYTLPYPNHQGVFDMSRLSHLSAGLSALLLAATLGVANAQTVGEPAPAFDLPDQYGDRHTLDDFTGRWLVVYFYPKADTPGCTTEACNFRDNIYAIRGAGADVVGISVDTVEDQRAFSDKYKLPFPVLSDVGGQASSAYGVLREMGSMDFAGRETFPIDPEGLVVKHYEQVDPETHTQDVVADLQELREDYSPAG